MNRRFQRTTILFLLCTFAMTNLVAAQSVAPYSLIFWTTSNGNGLSSGQTYLLEDVVGQPFLPVSSPTPVPGDQPAYTLYDGYLTEPQRVENLLLLYVNGDNDLWGTMRELVNNIQKGAIGANAVILMVLDGPGERDSYRYRVAKQEIPNCNLYDFHAGFQSSTDAIKPEDSPCHNAYLLGHNMEPFREDLGNPNTLATFLTEGINEYPSAEHILVAMVGHGGGWSPNVLAGQPPRIGGKPGGYGDDNELGGLLWDSHSEDPERGTSLSTPELGEALAQTYHNTGRRIDLLYLDACLMGMWEVAYEIQTPVHYLLTSESWNWTTFAYDQHIMALSRAKTIPAIGTQWIRNEIAVLCPDGTCRQPVPYTYSLLDLNAMNPISATMNNLGTVLNQNLDAQKKAAIDAAYRQTSCFDSNQDLVIDDRDTYCDLYSFATAIESVFTDQTIRSAAGELKQTLTNSLVVTESHQSGRLPYGYPPNRWEFGPDIRGLSSYLPLNRDAPPEPDGSDYGWKLNYYDQLTFARNNTWDDFLTNYLPTPTHGPDCTENCPLPPAHLQARYRIYLPIVSEE